MNALEVLGFILNDGFVSVWDQWMKLHYNVNHQENSWKNFIFYTNGQHTSVRPLAFYTKLCLQNSKWSCKTVFRKKNVSFLRPVSPILKTRKFYLLLSILSTDNKSISHSNSVLVALFQILSPERILWHGAALHTAKSFGSFGHHDFLSPETPQSQTVKVQWENCLFW